MPYKDKEKQKKFQREWVAKRRETWLSEHGPCECGSWEGLEVDHIDPETKVTHKVWSWTRVKREAELAKCRVLCKQCHRQRSNQQLRRPIRHGTRVGWERGCRCDSCHEALKAHWKLYREKKRQEVEN